MHTLWFALLFLLSSACSPQLQTKSGIFTITEVVPTTPVPPTHTPTLIPSPTATATFTPFPPTPTNTPASPPLSLKSLQIAFIDQANLTLWRDGKTVVLTDIKPDGKAMDFDPAVNTYPVDFSNDGKYIAFIRGDGGVWVISTDGTGEKNLFRTDTPDYPRQQRPYLIGWLPGTHTLLFSEMFWYATSIYSPAGYFYAANVDTGQVKKQVVFDTTGSDFYPAPDGKNIVVVHGDDIYLVDSQGKNLRKVFSSSLVNSPEKMGIRTKPVWAGDSRTFVMATLAVDQGRFLDKPTEIWQVPVDKGLPKRLAQLPLPVIRYGPPDEYSGDPGIAGLWIAPDFAHVVYRKALKDTPSFSDPFELHLAPIDLSEDKVVYTGDINTDVYWSPDAQSFIIGKSPLLISDIKGETKELTAVEEGDDIAWIDRENLLLFNGLGFRWASVYNQESLIIEQADYSPPMHYFRQFDFTK